MIRNIYLNANHPMFIYKTTNLINGKIYVGKCQADQADSYLGSGLLLSYALKKYGRENFKREILEDCGDDVKFLCEREKFWIKELNSNDKKVGYNIAVGGNGGDYITFHPNREEICIKYKNAQLKRFADPVQVEEFKQAMDRFFKTDFGISVLERRTNSIRERMKDPEYRRLHKIRMKELGNTPEMKKKRSENSTGENNSRWLGYADIYDEKGIFLLRYASLKTFHKSKPFGKKKDERIFVFYNVTKNSVPCEFSLNFKQTQIKSDFFNLNKS